MLLLLKYRLVSRRRMRKRMIKRIIAPSSVPDELWDEIKVILPREKPLKTVGRPIVQIQRYLMEFYTSLELGANGRCYPKSINQFHVHRRFQEWNKLDVFKKTWVRLLKIYNKSLVSTGHGNQSIDYLHKIAFRGGDDRK